MDDSKLKIGKDDDIRKEMQVDLKKKRFLVHQDEEGYTLLVDDGKTKRDLSDEDREFFKSLSIQESQEEEAADDGNGKTKSPPESFLFDNVSELIQKRQQDGGVIHHRIG